VAAAFSPRALLLATFTTTAAGYGNRGIDRVSRELIEDALFHIYFHLCYENVTLLYSTTNRVKNNRAFLLTLQLTRKLTKRIDNAASYFCNVLVLN